MVSTDPIADMLTRIRNATSSGQSQVSLPHSKIKETIARNLATNGFLVSVSIDDNDGRKMLNIIINSEGANSTITELARLSRPGRRVYVAAKDIPTIKHGRGLVLISTSQGVMTGQEARTKNLGGELICQIY
jgi:small subunit ribosomal protein S8